MTTKEDKIKREIELLGKKKSTTKINNWIDNECDINKRPHNNTSGVCMFHIKKPYAEMWITEFAICIDCVYVALGLSGTHDIIGILNRK